MFSVLQFFSRLQDLFQFFKASLQYGAQGSWTSSTVEFQDVSTSCFCAIWIPGPFGDHFRKNYTCHWAQLPTIDSKAKK